MYALKNTKGKRFVWQEKSIVEIRCFFSYVWLWHALFYSISYYNLRRINIQLSRNPCSNHTLHNSKRRGELSSPQDKYFHKNITKYVTVIAGANAPFQTGTRCLIIPITFLTIIYTANIRAFSSPLLARGFRLLSQRSGFQLRGADRPPLDG